MDGKDQNLVEKTVETAQTVAGKTVETAQTVVGKTMETAQTVVGKTVETAQTVAGEVVEKTGEALLKEYRKKRTQEIIRLVMIVAASFIMAMNLKSLVRTGDLFPGGFTGLTRLIQEICRTRLGVEPPFTVINVLLNAIPAAICYKYIGKKFTTYSCLMIVLTSVLTDLLPVYAFTSDILLISVFGGVIHGISISICLFAGATSGGTDFISIFLAEKFDMDAWNYIFMGNIVILMAAGYLFGWDKALYSIVFQFVGTQVLNTLYKRYQKQTLFIVTEKPDEVYEKIRAATNHDATLIKGVGCYQNRECNILYSVIGRDEVRKVLNIVRRTDEKAFINVIRTESLSGLFYKKPND